MSAKRGDDVPLQSDYLQTKSAAVSGFAMDIPIWTVIFGGDFNLIVSRVGGRGSSLQFDFTDILPDDLSASVVPLGLGVVPGAYDYSQSFSTSYFIFDVDSRSSTQLFVCGHPIGRDGVVDTETTVVEEWTLVLAPGWPTTSRPVSTAGIGVAIAQTELTAGIVGPSYLLPADRARATINREALVTVNAPITSLSIDPDGRYLMLSELGAGVLQVDLTHPSLTTVSNILPSSVYPHLGDVAELKFGVFNSGEKFLLATSEDSYRTYCTDANNDGVFESVTTLSFLEAQEGGLTHPSAWASDYRNYDLSGSLFGQ